MNPSERSTIPTSEPSTSSSSSSSFSYYDDQSDRKTLLQLEKQLLDIKNSAIYNASNVTGNPKYKQLPKTNYCQGRPPTKRKISEMKKKYMDLRNQCAQDKTILNPKKRYLSYQKQCRSETLLNCPTDQVKESTTGGIPNSFLKAVSAYEKQCSTNTFPFSLYDTEVIKNQRSDIKNEVVRKPSTITKSWEEDKPETITNQSALKENLSSDSFTKYGVQGVYFADFLESKKPYEQHLRVPSSAPSTSTSKIILDCKHLTNDDLIKAHEENYTYICNIITGTSDCVDQQNCFNQNPGDYLKRMIRYNTSTLIFRSEQKQVLANLLTETLNKHSELDSNTHTKYISKVLLPELCLKIFMDTHSMNYDQATAYLENMPLEDLSI